MNTLEYLNNGATLTYTDNRPANVLFDRPRPKDTAPLTITDVEFTVIPAINIVEIIKPNITNVRYKLELYDLSAIVEWDNLPANCTVTINAPVWTVSGIESAEDWEAVKAPTIKLSEDNFGNFAYQANIIYDTSTETDITVTWNVGYYIPQALFETIASFVFGDNVSFTRAGAANLNSKFTLSGTLIKTIAIIEAEATLEVSYDVLAGEDWSDSITQENNFGESMFIDNDYTLVSSLVYSNAPKVYVYNTSTGTLDYTLNNPNDYSPTLNDRFGASLAMSNNYIMVGAPTEDATTDVDNDGRAYIFDKSSKTLLHTLQEFNDQAAAQDQLGYQVAITDSYAVASAPFTTSIGTTTYNGLVYVYSPSDGYKRYSITDPDYVPTIYTPNGQFGRKLQLFGSTLVVGGSDRIHVYTLGASATLEHSISNPISGEDFSSSTIYANANYIAVEFNSNVYVFDTTTGTLEYTLNYSGLVGLNSNYIFVESGLATDGGTISVDQINIETGIETKSYRDLTDVYPSKSGQSINGTKLALTNSYSHVSGSVFSSKIFVYSIED